MNRTDHPLDHPPYQRMPERRSLATRDHAVGYTMERTGIEPVTSCLQSLSAGAMTPPIYRNRSSAPRHLATTDSDQIGRRRYCSSPESSTRALSDAGCSHGDQPSATASARCSGRRPGFLARRLVIRLTPWLLVAWVAFRSVGGIFFFRAGHPVIALAWLLEAMAIGIAMNRPRIRAGSDKDLQ